MDRGPAFSLHGKGHLVSLAAALVLVAGGLLISRAWAEEEGSKKVLTLESAKGAEVVVGDKVATAVATANFTFSNGVVSCTNSKLEGKVTSNPEVGHGNAEFEVESWTFAGCGSTVGGAGSVWKKTTFDAELMPTTMETEPPEGGNGFTAGVNFPLETVGVEIGVETPAKLEIVCVFRWKNLHATYNNGNAEIEIFQAVATGKKVVKNCGSCPPEISYPSWSADYDHLRDETGIRAGKRIWIN